jgi:hypothetical protein
MIKEKFRGRWKLESVVVKHADNLLYPFGKDIKAILFYDEEYMSVQIMMPHNVSLEENRENVYKLKDLAWSLKNFGYMGYFGKYEIDEEKHQVIHHVEGAITQNLVGGQEIRNYTFEDGKMILSTGPMELTWVKF